MVAGYGWEDVLARFLREEQEQLLKDLASSSSDLETLLTHRAKATVIRNLFKRIEAEKSAQKSDLRKL